MAICSTIRCLICKETKSVVHSASRCAPDICWECRKEQEAEKKEYFLDKLKTLSLEERVGKIEE